MSAYPTIDDLPLHLRGDPLAKMRAFRLAYVLQEKAWGDTNALRKHPLTEPIAEQLYTAIGSIAANLAEGYSRSSGRDRARMFEYAVGSAREAMVWYMSALPVLGEEITKQRVEPLEEIRRLLLAAIPVERNRLIRPRAG